MKTIKTRTTVKNIKALDKTMDLGRRMKNTLVQVKERAQSADRQAEETQNPHNATPTDYATERVQITAQGAAREGVHILRNPRKKARDNWSRAKDHFQEVKRNLPKERRRIADETQKTARTANNTADRLHKTAVQAKETASEAKTAVKDAKQTLKEVRQAGRLKIREAKIKTKAEYTRATDYGGSVLPESGASGSPTAPGNAATPGKPTHQPFNRPAEAAPRNIGDSPTRPANASPARGNIPRPKPGQAQSVLPSKPQTMTLAKADIPARVPEAAPKRGLFRLGDTGEKAVKGADKAVDTVKATGKAAKSSKRAFKETAKGTIKTAKKTAKTAEKSAKTAVKTAKQTAKTAQKTAQASAKAAKIAAKTARAAAKAAVQTAKAAAKAVTAIIKATIAAVKGLVAAIAAGGWVAVLIILIVCMVGLLAGSIFGIFFSGEDSGNGYTMPMAIAEINQEYAGKISGIRNSTPHDEVVMTGSRALWKDVLAVYAVKTSSDPLGGQDVAAMDASKKAILQSIFWEMNVITHSTAEVTGVSVTVTDDGAGNLVETEETVTKTVLYINISGKTAAEMAEQYHFTYAQKAQLAELLNGDYDSMWTAVLYGIHSGSGEIVAIAVSQIGNVGGEPYWSWYGFSKRAEWCACFVSWCANEAGYIDAGVIPRFAGCQSQGVPWFAERGLWQDSSYTPAPGDIIFFDWNHDGEANHVGIVEYVEGEYVHTVEGNTSDSCARRTYRLDSTSIMGYGTPAYGLQ